MILVTVGTEKFAFNRLMQWIDNLIKGGLLAADREEIVIQYGSCTFVPNQANNYSLLPEQEFNSLISKARLIIAHCGEGTLDLLAQTTQPFVLVPRSCHYGEHVDDHQIELAEELAKQGIPTANSQEDLAKFLAAPLNTNKVIAPSDYYAQACSLLDAEFGTSQADRGLIPAWA
jgi:UDP-N-acetylglucosamine transferase subunit ALG13